MINSHFVRAAVLCLLLTILSGSANAVPAFARKYGTACQTCHTVFPKLTPFGEAFRRNGYRFPGNDSDLVKQEVIPLGQDDQKKEFPHATYPGTLPTSVPIALGFNGSAIFHPTKKSSAAVADNKTSVNLNDLVGEAQLWAAGSFDDLITYFGEVVFSSGGADVEHAAVSFNDLVGPKHVANLRVGKDFSTLSSFGPHSTYLGDYSITPLSVSALYGAQTDSWNTFGAYSGFELNGTVDGRLSYSAGLNAGANVDSQAPENFYGHMGYKLGGYSLDGEGNDQLPDSSKPWAEKAITFDAFFYHSKSRFTDVSTTDVSDVTNTFGGSIRGQWMSFELNTGIFQEWHDNALPGGGRVHAISQFNELSYVVFPWLVPAMRVEMSYVKPTGLASVNDIRFIPGIVALIRPNLKVSLVGQIEKAKGAPVGGWEPAAGAAAPSTPTSKVGLEMESISANLAYAF